MKQVKKLLVILPLVALFVLGSLSVMAATPYEAKGYEISLVFPDGVTAYTFSMKGSELLPEADYLAAGSKAAYAYATIKANLEAKVKGLPVAAGYTMDPADLGAALANITGDMDGTPKGTSESIGLLKEEVKDNKVKVIAFNIHNNKFVYDRLFELEIRDGWHSEKDISEAFYNNTETLKDKYLYAGFATKTIKPVIIYRATYLERIAEAAYMDALDKYGADIVVFVVPRVIKIETIHVFPEGTRANLTEIVPVPYEVWASLQHSSKFMNLPEIFKTRIQKVNEEGYAFKEIRYYNGENEIDGLLAGYDWFGMQIREEIGDDACYAKIFYDKAVAAAKEVPTEKKVDAATAPQAQIQAPAAQAPVTAANTTTTTAPVNTLPVTGASDSIFLFLSSAALMAVGILFFKKH